MKLIFEFLRYCLGNEVDMSGVVAGMNWQLLYGFASKQALLGLCFDGLERLGMEYPSFERYAAFSFICSRISLYELTRSSSFVINTV